MKKIIIINFLILFLASFSLQVHSQSRPDEKIFQEAKILIFDEKWESNAIYLFLRFILEKFVYWPVMKKYLDELQTDVDMLKKVITQNLGMRNAQ